MYVGQAIPLINLRCDRKCSTLTLLSHRSSFFQAQKPLYFSLSNIKYTRPAYSRKIILEPLFLFKFQQVLYEIILPWVDHIKIVINDHSKTIKSDDLKDVSNHFKVIINHFKTCYVYWVSLIKIISTCTSRKNLICCGFLAIICCGFGPKH